MIHPAQRHQQFKPYGASSTIFTRHYTDIVLSGPAGTGKSRAILEYLNYIATAYARVRLLMVRKTRRSLTESGMVTLASKVLDPAQRVVWKPSVQHYEYRNSSIIAVGGLDKPSKIMSSEWDIIYAQETTELTENDWESCSIRLRNGVLPWQQLIGDCNPGPPNHWLKQRANAGRTVMLESRHEDNPLLFQKGTMTTEGHRYLAQLDQLSGVRKLRYRHGVWAAAEGMIYEDAWDAAQNIVDRFPIPPDWPRYLAIDFGYTNPFVCLWFAQDPDGRLYIYRELYQTRRLVEDHARDILRLSQWGTPHGEPEPRLIVCDHDAEGRATLDFYLRLMTTAADKAVATGIQTMAARLRPAGDGRPRLFYLRDSLVQRDTARDEAKLPCSLTEEIDAYVWDIGHGLNKGDSPVKAHDHALDAARYLIMTLQDHAMPASMGPALY